MAKPVPTIGPVVEKGAEPEKAKKYRLTTVFHCTNL
jgi:hypothetical protein